MHFTQKRPPAKSCVVASFSFSAAALDGVYYALRFDVRPTLFRASEDDITAERVADWWLASPENRAALNAMIKPASDAPRSPHPHPDHVRRRGFPNRSVEALRLANSTTSTASSRRALC
jgi:hypothetical protein